MSLPLSRPSRVDDALLLALSARLTDRDRTLCELLAEHRVLTTGQISDVAFTGIRRAQLRLSMLHRLRIVDRFRPHTEVGSAPLHWVLDEAGAAVVAAARGVDVTDLPWRRDKALALARNQHLAHLVGVNGTFTALIRAARRRPGCRLAVWWSERRCAAEWGELVRPDGYGLWVEPAVRLPFLLEYDTGSERLHRLADKLPGYADLTAAADGPTWLLFRFRTARREVDARRALATAVDLPVDVPIATSAEHTPGHPARDPAAAVWLPLQEAGPRRPLADLARLTPTEPTVLSPRGAAATADTWDGR